MDTNLNESLWSASELMGFLGCGKTTFYKEKQKGNLPPCIKISSGVERWNPASVREWVKGRETITGVNHRRSETKSKYLRRGRPTKASQVESR